MTDSGPVTLGYDPTQRLFKGPTAFALHPSSLRSAADLVWQPAYSHGAPAAASARATPPDEAWSDVMPIMDPAKPTPIYRPRPRAPTEADLADLTLDDPQARPRPPSEADLADLAFADLPSLPDARLRDARLRERGLADDRPGEGKLPSYMPRHSPAADAPLDDAAPARRRIGARGIGLCCLVVLAAIAVAVRVFPGLFASPPTFVALFTAPMLRLSAVGAGQIASVAVAIGQPVEPSTVLLTVHVDHVPDAALDALRARLEQAKQRGNAAEIDQLQKAIAAAGGNAQTDLPVVAGVHGVVWALDGQAGARIQAGDALAQLADCGRAFMVLRSAPAVAAGNKVMIRMPGLRPFHGVVRASSGPSEPAKALVIEPTEFTTVAPKICPVGAAAEVQVDKG